MGLITKLAKRMKELSSARAQSLPDESEEDRRLRILRQKMRVNPKRPATEKRRGETANTTD